MQLQRLWIPLVPGWGKPRNAAQTNATDANGEDRVEVVPRNENISLRKRVSLETTLLMLGICLAHVDQSGPRFEFRSTACLACIKNSLLAGLPTQVYSCKAKSTWQSNRTCRVLLTNIPNLKTGCACWSTRKRYPFSIIPRHCEREAMTEHASILHIR